MSDPGEDEDPRYEDGEDFHRRNGPVYREPLGAAVFKRRRHMAHVRYRDTHCNPAETGPARGRGENRSDIDRSPVELDPIRTRRSMARECARVTAAVA